MSDPRTTVDKWVQWAGTAAQEGKSEDASHYYEEAARRTVFSDADAAGHLFLLAARHAQADPERAKLLYTQAKTQFERCGAADSAGDMLLEIALLAQRCDAGEAAEDLIVACRAYTNALVLGLAGTGTPQEKQATLLPIIDKIRFCLTSISTAAGDRP